MTEEQRAKDLADRRAAAAPRDWPEDFDRETEWSVCERCIHVFLGVPDRIRCRQCTEQGNL